MAPSHRTLPNSRAGDTILARTALIGTSLAWRPVRRDANDGRTPFSSRLRMPAHPSRRSENARESPPRTGRPMSAPQCSRSTIASAWRARLRYNLSSQSPCPLDSAHRSRHGGAFRPAPQIRARPKRARRARYSLCRHLARTPALLRLGCAISASRNGHRRACETMSRAGRCPDRAEGDSLAACDQLAFRPCAPHGLSPGVLITDTPSTQPGKKRSQMA